MPVDFPSWLDLHLRCVTGRRTLPGGLPFQAEFPFAMLDFTPESLRAVDAYLEKHAVHLSGSGVPEEQWSNLARCLGCYLGEVYRRVTPTSPRWMEQAEVHLTCPWWAPRTRPELQWLAALLDGGGRITWPFHLALVALNNMATVSLNAAMIEMRRGGPGKAMRGHPVWETATPATSRMAEDMKALYSQLPAVLASFDLAPRELRLDFSLASVDTLDLIVDALLTSRQLNLDVRQIERNMLPLMAYVGEVVRRRATVPYVWTDHAEAFAKPGEPAFDITTAVVLMQDGRASFAYPGIWVYDRLYSDLPVTMAHSVRWACGQAVRR